MGQEQNDKHSIRSEAIVVLLSAIAGSSVGWLLWLAMGNIAVALGLAGPVAALMNNFLRKIIK